MTVSNFGNLELFEQQTRYSGTGAAVEYAVLHLKVINFIHLQLFLPFWVNLN